MRQICPTIERRNIRLLMNRPPDYTINVCGRLISLARPQIMGILNATPDSFYAGSRKQTEADIAQRADIIVEEGGTIIDVGAFSTRPGAAEVTEAEETARMRRALAVVRRGHPDVPLSIDTFRPDVARMAVEEFGAGIINDVSGGNTGGAFGGTDPAPGGVNGRCTPDDEYPPMFRMAARLGVPYILMSTRATLRDMMIGFAGDVCRLRELGVKDIILDPGFGFGKTLQQNYAILAGLERLGEMELPVLVGASRKSMIFRLLGSTPDEASNGTTVVNTIAIAKGASILRVHDVKACAEAIRIVEETIENV